MTEDLDELMCVSCGHVGFHYVDDDSIRCKFCNKWHPGGAPDWPGVEKYLREERGITRHIDLGTIILGTEAEAEAAKGRAKGGATP